MDKDEAGVIRIPNVRRDFEENSAAAKPKHPKTLLVSGSRDWTDVEKIVSALNDMRNEGYTRLVHGGCRGLDCIAAAVAMGMGFEVIKEDADWEKFGKKAGPIRNQMMVDGYQASFLLAFPMGEARGTGDMIRRAKRAGISMRIITL